VDKLVMNFLWRWTIVLINHTKIWFRSSWQQ